LAKREKATKNQQCSIVHLTEAEKHQAMVKLIAKMVVDITLKEFEEERRSATVTLVYCLPCLSLVIKSGT
jgi:hypothetical protein